MQIKEALHQAKKILSKSTTPELESRLLLCKILSITYEQLILAYTETLSANDKEKFFKLVGIRKSGKPIAYIIGKQEFYGLEFIVDKNVLIPRPETELLVECVINDCKERFINKSVKILELGTGSGAISIALAKYIITSQITAVDISNTALHIARINAKNHQIEKQINFIKSDWYESLNDQIDIHAYDYVVSNPPYISPLDVKYMSFESRKFEPKIALYALQNGLASYKTIISKAHTYLKTDGKLLLEIGYNQKNDVANLCKKYNFLAIDTLKDLAGLDRVIIAQIK